MTLLVCLFFFLGTAAALFLIAEGGRSYVRRSEIEDFTVGRERGFPCLSYAVPSFLTPLARQRDGEPGKPSSECVGCGAPAVTVYRGMAVCQSFAQELEEDVGGS